MTNKTTHSTTTFSGGICSLYRWFWRFAVLFFLFAVAFIVSESFRFADLLGRLHPHLSWAIPVIVSSLLLWAFWRMASYFRVPKAIRQPLFPPIEEGWNTTQQRQYVDYAVRYLRRQKKNPRLPQSSKTQIDPAIEKINAPLAREAVNDPVRAARALATRVEIAFKTILEPLDAEAHSLIQRAAVEVSIATAVAPSALMDALVTLTRNIDLISRLADLYYGRPGFGGTVKLIRDVIGSAMAAGISQMVTEKVFSGLSELTGSWTSRLLGPLGQGLMNGILTIRLGTATQQRCRSVVPTRVSWSFWSASDYARVVKNLVGWMSDSMGTSIGQPLTNLVSSLSQTANKRQPSVTRPDDPVFSGGVLGS